jgi:hypothetical protein
MPDMILLTSELSSWCSCQRPAASGKGELYPASPHKLNNAMLHRSHAKQYALGMVTSFPLTSVNVSLPSNQTDVQNRAYVNMSFTELSQALKTKKSGLEV